MDFLTETKDYNVAEFHNMFQDKLPKFVKISQGYFGDIADDVFDRDQVLRIECVSRQQRVISKMTFKSNQERLLSIPATYVEKLCVVKHGKVGKETLLQNILMDNHLPLTVRFPKDRSVKVGFSSLSTNFIPSMELTHTFDEVYLLGNIINDGVLCTGVVPVPLYLSQLRMAIITGIKDQPENKWKIYQKEVAGLCATIEYDLSYGNQNIAEYDPSAIHSDSVYSYVEPRAYSNIVSLIKRPQRGDNKAEEESKENVDNPDDTYEEIRNTPPAPPSAPTLSFAKELKSRLKSTKKKQVSSHSKDQTDKKTSGPPPIAPKPKLHATDDDTAPELPKRREKQQIYTNTTDVPGNQYYNDVPRSFVTPSFSKPDYSERFHQPTKPTKEAPPTVTEQSIATPNVTDQSVDMSHVKNSDDVSKLTIDEVIACMKRLGLGQYENEFREQMIDGALLVELDKEILKEEFGLKVVEALRLMKFVKDGHIPV